MHAIAHFFAGVMPCGDGFCALLYGVFQKAFEFDFGVAQHIRVGRSARFVFLQKIGEHFVFVLRREVYDVDINTDDVGDRHRIERVFFDAAILVVVVVFPVLHEDAAHVVLLLVQQRGGYGAIHSA